MDARHEDVFLTKRATFDDHRCCDLIRLYHYALSWDSEVFHKVDAFLCHLADLLFEKV
jgi:hypothetical protein